MKAGVHWCIKFVVAVTLICAGEPVVAGAQTPSNAPPFVGCASDGQLGPRPAPPAGRKTPRLDPEMAGKLSYYVSDDLMVLGPRGWRCFGLYGSNGSVLIVTPEALPLDVFKSGIKLTGPAFR